MKYTREKLEELYSTGHWAFQGKYQDVLVRDRMESDGEIDPYCINGAYKFVVEIINRGPKGMYPNGWSGSKNFVKTFDKAIYEAIFRLASDLDFLPGGPLWLDNDPEDWPWARVESNRI